MPGGTAIQFVLRHLTNKKMTNNNSTVATPPGIDPKGKNCIITGGAGGIGSSLARILHKEGAKNIYHRDTEVDWLKLGKTRDSLSGGGLVFLVNIGADSDFFCTGAFDSSSVVCDFPGS